MLFISFCFGLLFTLPVEEMIHKSPGLKLCGFIYGEQNLK